MNILCFTAHTWSVSLNISNEYRHNKIKDKGWRVIMSFLSPTMSLCFGFCVLRLFIRLSRRSTSPNNFDSCRNRLAMMSWPRTRSQLCSTTTASCWRNTSLLQRSTRLSAWCERTGSPGLCTSVFVHHEHRDLREKAESKNQKQNDPQDNVFIS